MNEHEEEEEEENGDGCTTHMSSRSYKLTQKNRNKKCGVGPSFPLRRFFRSREQSTETDAFSERKEGTSILDGWTEKLVTRKYHSFIHFNPFVSRFCSKETENERTLMNMVVGWSHWTERI